MEAGSQITRVTRAQSYIPVENPTQNPTQNPAQNPTQNSTQRQRKIERSKHPQRAATSRKTEQKLIDRPELSQFYRAKQE